LRGREQSVASGASHACEATRRQRIESHAAQAKARGCRAAPDSIEEATKLFGNERRAMRRPDQ